MTFLNEIQRVRRTCRIHESSELVLFLFSLMRIPLSLSSLIVLELSRLNFIEPCQSLRFSTPTPPCFRARLVQIPASIFARKRENSRDGMLPVFVEF